MKSKNYSWVPYILLLISGLLLNISFFGQNIYAQILALFSIAPAFYAITKLEGIKRYLGGIVFFAVWFIPTLYWWFLIFEWWDALLRLTFLTFLALAFYVPTFFKKRNLIVDFIIIIIIWTAISTARINLPFSQSWWMTHIGYTQWLNPLLVQIVGILGVTGLIATILISNATAAYLFLKKKYTLLIIFMVIVIGACLTGNFYLHNNTVEDKNYTIVAVQSAPSGGVSANANTSDIETLMDMTVGQFESISKEKPIIVVWPENMIQEKEDSRLKQFARDYNIYLAYNRSQSNGEEDPFNTVVIIDNQGQVVLTNYKKHKAPGEMITERDDFISIEIGNTRVTADICYDLHFKDIGERINGEHLLIAPVDDDKFGKFMPYLHAADTTFRAIENNIDIVTASTNGPTFFVNRNGVVEEKPLTIYDEAILVVE